MGIPRRNSQHEFRRKFAGWNLGGPWGP
jgi:hypothetical protein